MKKSKFRDYLDQSLTGFGSLALAILFFFILYKMSDIIAGFKVLMGILSPFLLGGVMALILSPLCCSLDDRLIPYFRRHMKNQTRAEHLGRGLSVAAAIIFTIAIIYALLMMVMPELIKSIRTLYYNIPKMEKDLQTMLDGLFKDNPEQQSQIDHFFNSAGSNMQNWLRDNVLPNIDTLVTNLTHSVRSALTFILNLFVGFVVAAYLLMSRKLFASQAKKLAYCLWSIKTANSVIELNRESKRIFNDFFTGKLLDSLIIGIICFVGCSFLKMPYIVLISVIVGVTNIIPFFGPFIGAIPSAILVLTVSPRDCLIFLIFVLCLQQFDGNILGPKILGDSIGISGFWVLFSLLFFGGFFGFAGMIFGVPVFTIVYNLISKAVRASLNRKHLPPDSLDYKDDTLLHEEKVEDEIAHENQE